MPKLTSLEEEILLEENEAERWDLNQVDRGQVKRLSNLFLVSRQEHKAMRLRRQWLKEEKEEEQRERWLFSFNN